MPAYPHPDVQLIIFARAPLAGYCKTRLIPTLGEQAAADLQHELLKQTINQLCSPPRCPTQLWCSPDTLHPAFKSLADNYALTLHTQQGKGLGDRMYHAMSDQAAAYTIVVGTDCPVMTSEYIEQAIGLLYEGSQAVIGPAEDGGYVLLGLQDITASLFQGIAWGSNEVFNQTRQKLTRAGLRWQPLDTLWDVDDEVDLRRYRNISDTHTNKNL